MHGDNGWFTCQKFRKVGITERTFPKRLENTQSKQAVNK